MGRINNEILAILQGGQSHSASQLALLTNANEASIRRSIQELRRDGYNISFGPDYRMGDR